jgi:hypothetical protein
VLRVKAAVAGRLMAQPVYPQLRNLFCALHSLFPSNLINQLGQMRKLLGCGYDHPYHCYYVGPNRFGKDIVGDETKASGDGQAFFFPENIGERCAFGTSPHDSFE